MNAFDCVALLILDGDKLLVEKQRSDKATDPGITVVPSGHVKNGEKLEEACKRELEEELELQCNSFNEVGFLLWSTPIELQRVHFFLCEYWSGEPKPHEAEAVFWIGADSLHLIDIAEERKVLEMFFLAEYKIPMPPQLSMLKI